MDARVSKQYTGKRHEPEILESPGINPLARNERRKLFTARGSKQLNDKIYSFGSTPTLRLRRTTKGQGCAKVDLGSSQHVRTRARTMDRAQWCWDDVRRIVASTNDTIPEDGKGKRVAGSDAGCAPGMYESRSLFRTVPFLSCTGLLPCAQSCVVIYGCRSLIRRIRTPRSPASTSRSLVPHTFAVPSIDLIHHHRHGTTGDLEIFWYHAAARYPS